MQYMQLFYNGITFSCLFWAGSVAGRLQIWLWDPIEHPYRKVFPFFFFLIAISNLVLLETMCSRSIWYFAKPKSNGCYTPTAWKNLPLFVFHAYLYNVPTVPWRRKQNLYASQRADWHWKVVQSWLDLVEKTEWKWKQALVPSPVPATT